MGIYNEYMMELLGNIATGEHDIRAALNRMAGYAASKTECTLRFARQVETALLGDREIFEHGLSPVHTLGLLIRAYGQEHDWENDEDPDATTEAIAECERTLLQIREALGRASNR